ncbi:MAG TPA: SpoIIE family protein phosphatase [Solirubrobacteraceae bacterium]|nr:SpoIIE family protein phosphatase [Solirubrobacteraceae bacterium]
MALTHTSAQVGELRIETAAMTKEGEDVSGDRACIGHSEAGVLVSVVDGLGHGADAGHAAQRASVVLEDPATGMRVGDALQRCHVALRGTRGAVIALAAFPAHATDMEWLAVGNIEGVLVRSRSSSREREMIVQRPGIVGHHMPPLRSSTLPVTAGDTLVFATDGVRREVAQAVARRGTARLPGGVADLLEEFATGTDDALVLTARYGETA